jgi:hypothetical protein
MRNISRELRRSAGTHHSRSDELFCMGNDILLTRVRCQRVLRPHYHDQRPSSRVSKLKRAGKPCERDHGCCSRNQFRHYHNHRAHNVSLPSKTVAHIRANEAEHESGVRSAVDAISSRTCSGRECHEYLSIPGRESTSPSPQGLVLIV